MVTKSDVKKLEGLVNEASKKENIVLKVYKKYKTKIDDDVDVIGNITKFSNELIKNKPKKTEELVNLLIFIKGLSTVKGGKTTNSINGCQPPLPPSKYTFKDIAGQEELKRDMKVNFIYPFTYPGLFKKKGNILLYGPPGVGKSFTAKAAVSEIKSVAFFAPTSGELKGKYEGETEKNIDTVFKCAEQTATSPKYNFSIIFLDEFDAIAAKGRGEDASLARSVNALLASMDGISSQENVSVLAATNYPWNIDDAIMRRFSARVFVDLPDEKARKFLIKQSLLENYYYPGIGMDNPERKNNIEETEDFVPYQLFEQFGLCEDKKIKVSTYKGLSSKMEKRKVCYYVDDEFVNELVEMTGPTEEGKKVKVDIIDAKSEDYEDKAPMFGYSGSDISKMMETAIQISSFRALGGNFIQGSGKFKGYWIFNPNTKKGKNKDNIGNKSKLISFDLRKSDVTAALKRYTSTIRNDAYIELLKYSKEF